MQVWGCGNVEEGGSFANEFRSVRWFGIEVDIEVFGEDVEEVDVDKLKAMVHVKDEDIAALDKYVAPAGPGHTAGGQK